MSVIKKYFSLFRQTGEEGASLLQVIGMGALLSALAVYVASTQKDTSSSLKGDFYLEDVFAINQKIQSILSDEASCSAMANNFNGGSIPADSTPYPATTLRVDSSAPFTGELLQVTTDPAAPVYYGATERVYVTDLNIRRRTDSDGDLIINYAINDEFIGLRELIREIPLRFTKSAPATPCFANPDDSVAEIVERFCRGPGAVYNPDTHQCDIIGVDTSVSCPANSLMTGLSMNPDTLMVFAHCEAIGGADPTALDTTGCNGSEIPVGVTGSGDMICIPLSGDDIIHLVETDPIPCESQNKHLVISPSPDEKITIHCSETDDDKSLMLAEFDYYTVRGGVGPGPANPIAITQFHPYHNSPIVFGYSDPGHMAPAWRSKAARASFLAVAHEAEAETVGVSTVLANIASHRHEMEEADCNAGFSYQLFSESTCTTLLDVTSVECSAIADGDDTFSQNPFTMSGDYRGSGECWAQMPTHFFMTTCRGYPQRFYLKVTSTADSDLRSGCRPIDYHNNLSLAAKAPIPTTASTDSDFDFTFELIDMDGVVVENVVTDIEVFPSAQACGTPHSSAPPGTFTIEDSSVALVNGEAVFTKAHYDSAGDIYIRARAPTGTFWNQNIAQGCFGPINISAPGGGAPDLPVINGIVRTIISDGSGGYYIGGRFRAADDHDIKDIAHINDDGTLDTSFKYSLDFEEVNTINGVHALLLQGNNLYVAGNFNAMIKDGSAPTVRHHIGAIDVSTNTITSFQPNNRPNGANFSEAIVNATHRRKDVILSLQFYNSGGPHLLATGFFDYLGMNNASSSPPPGTQFSSGTSIALINLSTNRAPIAGLPVSGFSAHPHGSPYENSDRNNIEIPWIYSAKVDDSSGRTVVELIGNFDKVMPAPVAGIYSHDTTTTPYTSTHSCGPSGYMEFTIDTSGCRMTENTGMSSQCTSTNCRSFSAGEFLSSHSLWTSTPYSGSGQAYFGTFVYASNSTNRIFSLSINSTNAALGVHFFTHPSDSNRVLLFGFYDQVDSTSRNCAAELHFNPGPSTWSITSWNPNLCPSINFSNDFPSGSQCFPRTAISFDGYDKIIIGCGIKPVELFMDYNLVVSAVSDPVAWESLLYDINGLITADYDF